MTSGLFDFQFRFEKINANGDPLVVLNGLIDWQRFRPLLDTLRDKPRKSNAGAKGYDVVLMFKILILKSLFNLSNEAVENQILDRLSFMRFLGLGIGDDVPDSRTIWLFEDQLKEAKLYGPLFESFDAFLSENGFAARKGQIVDATLVPAPRQRNTREENEKIKQGQPVEGWSDKKRRHKDTDARWTKKYSKTYFGYKNHVAVDVENKFIRAWDVTAASVHDSQVFLQLLGENTDPDVWADAAYNSEQSQAELAKENFVAHLQEQARRGHPLSEEDRAANTARARIRVRVEHVFGVMTQRMGNLLIRTIGMARARCKIGLRNLAYNMSRYAMLKTAQA